MKRILAIASTSSLYLFTALSSFAQTPEGYNPCPTGTFSKLCDTNVAPNKIIQTIIAILLLAAVLLSLGYLIYGGIRWILSGGEKAKVDAARGTIVGAIIGLVIAFAAFFFLNIVASIFGLGTNLLDIKIPAFR